VRVSRSIGIGALLAIVLLSAGACTQKAEAQKDAPAELPALEFRADTPNLMITWIDPQGGTHVEGSPDQVPEAARDFVRIVISDRSEGTTDPIYVSDLTQRSQDGAYTTRSLSRRAWEDEIERRREKNAAVAQAPDGSDDRRRQRDPSERRAPPGPRPDVPSPDGTAAPDKEPPPAKTPLSHIKVTVYGAEWCGPCHQALAHLKKRGIAATFKDIDKDKVAQAEMQLKLEKIGKGGGRIPVIDVEGKILVGYSQRALDEALTQAAGGTAL
jgi:glutaredoxin